MPNVSLGSRWDQFVTEKVESGEFQTASEVIRAGLRLLEAHDEETRTKLDELRKAVRAGIESADAGSVRPFTKALLEELKTEAATRAKASR
ncbi:MAG: type II toxin-antitoxin system ParD family antitoxin [Planctomycetota bacterium]